MATANATVTLVISTVHGKPSELVDATPHSGVNKIANFLTGAASGEQYAKIDAYSTTSAPVAASGTITLTYASISANDTITIGPTTLTCVTGTPSAGQFKKVTDGPTTATNLAAAIAADATLGAVLTAVAVSGVVTITANEKGLFGNLVGMATSNGTGFALSAATLASGAGGAQGTATTWRHGL